MKMVKIFISICLMSMLGFVSADLAFGGAFGAPENPSTSPPYGLKVEGAVAGTKLNGFITNKYIGKDVEGNCKWFPCSFNNSYNCAEADIVVRLKSGNNYVTLYGHFDEVRANATAIQNILTEEMKYELLVAFGFIPANSPPTAAAAFNINLSDIQNLAQVDGEKCFYTKTDGTIVSGNFVITADIVLSVK